MASQLFSYYVPAGMYVSKHLAAQLREIALKFQPYVRQILMPRPYSDPFFSCRVNGEEVRLMLWDTAGQEEFDAITKVPENFKH